MQIAGPATLQGTLYGGSNIFVILNFHMYWFFRELFTNPTIGKYPTFFAKV